MMLIRAARPEDAAACAAILNDWIDATPWMPRCHPHRDVVRHYREDVFPNRTVLIAEGEAVQGFLALGRDGFVTGLYLSAPARGQRIGARLLDRAKAVRPEGLSLWTFQENLGARRFYMREGFTEERRTQGENEEGLPDILYTWPRRR